MKVIINAASANLGGAATYIKNLMRELASLHLDYEFIAFLPEDQAREILDLAPNIHVVPLDISESSWSKRLWFDQVTLRRFIKREKVDVLYSTGNFGMFACPCRQILLVRNSLYFSELYRKYILSRKGWLARIENAARRWLICQSVKWVDIVIVPSQSMLDELKRFVAIGPAKGMVNYYGTVLEYFGGALTSRQQALSNDHNKPLKILHVAHYADYKNIGVLLQAMILLQQRHNEQFRLLTTALVHEPRCPDSVFRPRDQVLLNDTNIAGAVQVLGDVHYAMLPKLYADAFCLVFPSITESFGHPMAEALASGLPTIAADTPINREILGDTGLYFDPFDAEGLTTCILRLAHDKNLYQSISAAATERSKLFDWHAHVESLLHLFNALAPKELGADSRLRKSTEVQ